MSGEATERVRKAWDSQAKKWFEHRDAMLTASRPIHEWLVAHLDPQPGQRVLEIAAGPGDTGFLAARLLGGGQLVSTDISAVMVDSARKRAAELGVTNAEHRVLDAQKMDLPDSSFDGVICRWGFMLMPEPQTALRECRRILAPGGRLVFAVFTGPDENAWASIPPRILIAAGHLPPPATGWQPGILALGDRARLQTLLDEAGFSSTEIERVDMTWTFTDADDYWHFLVDLTALGPLSRSLGSAVRNALRAELVERVASFTRPDGAVALPARCWCGLAVA
jgi:ubiquinone/menaquinone biosynthesis C-methylase UbiE